MNVRAKLPRNRVSEAGSLLPAVGARTFRLLVELISFAVRECRDSDGHERGRDDQDNNSATQAVNDPGTRRGCLRVAESAGLGVGKCVQAKDRGSCQKEADRSNSGLASHDHAEMVFADVT